MGPLGPWRAVLAAAVAAEVDVCLQDRALTINITAAVELAAAAPECSSQISQLLCQRLSLVARLRRQRAALASAREAAPQRAFSKKVNASMVFHDDEPPKIAFFILAFNALENLKRLLQRLNEPWHFFLLHLDKKASWRKELQLQHLLDEVQPFHEVMKERFDVRRGGSSFLLVILRALELLMWQDWEYFINLNDNDYPITTNQAFHSYLQLHRSESFVHIGSPPEQRCKHGDCRKIDHVVVAAECVLSNASDLHALLPSEEEMHAWSYFPTWAGPDLLGLWRPLVVEVVDSLHRKDSLADLLLTQLRSAQQPDERFFQTLLVMPDLEALVDSGSLGRYSHFPATFHVWDALRLRPGDFLQKSGVPVQIYSPPLLRDTRRNFSSLLEAAARTPSIHFARKFDAKRSLALQRRLDLHAGSSEPQLDEVHHQAVVNVIYRRLHEAAQETLQAGTWKLETRPGRSHQHLIADHVRVTERLACAPQFRERHAFSQEPLSDSSVAMLRYVLAVRVGVGWDQDSESFQGPVSLVPSTGNVFAVIYLSGRPHYHPGPLQLTWLGPKTRLTTAVPVTGKDPLLSVAGPSLREAGSWLLQVSWEGFDVHQHFHANFPSEQAEQSFREDYPGSSLTLTRLSLTRPFMVYENAEDLMQRCDQTCLKTFFRVKPL